MAYEAGYSGFWLYRRLEAAGIRCLVVHPASIEVSSRDVVKTDKLSRQGNTRLRHMLVKAGWKAVRKDPVMREYYTELSKRVGKRRAIVAVARKLAGRIRAVLMKRDDCKLEYRKAA
jgi:transposase